jgi:hypothetical protein
MKISDSNNTAADYIDLNNVLINKNIEYRITWEENARASMLAYSGNLYPSAIKNLVTGVTDSIVKKEKDKPVYVNLPKRQWRVIGSFLRNNEPQYLITEASENAEEKDLVEVRQALDAAYKG